MGADRLLWSRSGGPVIVRLHPPPLLRQVRLPTLFE